MALQGTIETFALPDVMRLLASTSKTGRLRLEGSRGTGSVWVDGGKVVAGEASSAPHAGTPVEVVFELLRFTEGDFVFEADEAHASPGAAVEVEPTLAEAEAMLEEWKAIEAVVPSLDAGVYLAAELPGDEVTIDKDRWKVLVAVGSGTTVGTLGDRFELAELAVSRQVKELIEQGLVELGDAPVGGVAVIEDVVVVEVEPDEDVEEELVEAVVEAVEEAGAEADAPYEPFDPNGLVIEREPISDDEELEELEAEVEAEAEEIVAVAQAAGDAGLGDPSDAAEIARQLANLSPKAAKAVAAAAKATTPEEREAALAEVDDEEEPINRDLLIKFLGSVNG